MTVDPSHRLTPHFTWGELTGSRGHPDLVAANRCEAEAHLEALTATAKKAERVRAAFGRPIRVHSGFRGAALNAAVGGAATSQHVRGEALDFSIPGVDCFSVWDWIVEGPHLLYGQCLLEGRAGGPVSWIHLSLGEPWRDRERSREAGSNLRGGVVRITHRDGLPIRLT